MRFTKTALAGVWVVEPEPSHDDRGFFARVWSAEELEAHGLNARLAQCSQSYNRRAGTLRGMHYQRPPFEEAKLVTCTRGAIHDVVLDLRRGSATFGRWAAEPLTAGNRRMLYVPEGCAHGFQTLEDDSEVLYFISAPYSPAHAAGVRWDDPAFAIAWPPAAARIISPRDASYPDYRP